VLQRLTKQFGSQMAVDQLSLEIPAGQMIGFLGPYGKRTTLKMLTCMIQPTAGAAAICGFDPLTPTLEVKRHVDFIPESGAAFESLTGLEYFVMVAAPYRISPEAALMRIRQFMCATKLIMRPILQQIGLIINFVAQLQNAGMSLLGQNR
jgi:ABC-2 type transport system ATP-binding protein